MKSLPPNMRDALREAQVWRRAKTLAGAHRFACFLDEQSLELNPGATSGTLQANAVDGTELAVNPSFRYQQGDDPPPEIMRLALPLDGFLRRYPIAWVEDPGTGIWSPFWARGEWINALESLTPGHPAPAGMNSSIRRTLAAANILVPEGYVEKTRAHWQETCRLARDRLQADRYVIVSKMLAPLQIAALRGYYRTLVDEGSLPLGDNLVSGRYAVHSEIVASFFHPQLTPLVSSIAGEQLAPSYVYFSSYRSGADLPKHTDREQCEYSISLLADYVPDPAGSCGWPLLMEHPATPDIVHAANLGIGDAVIYRGRELVHFRPPLPVGHQSTSVFFHYVRRDFSGRLK